MHLAKLDTVFLPIGLIAFFLYRWFKYRFHTADWVFLIVYGLISLHALLHAFFISTIYFLDQVTRVLLPEPLAQIVVEAAAGYTSPSEILSRLISQNLILISVILLGCGLLVWAIWKFQPVVAKRLMSAEKRLQQILGIMAALLGVFLMGVYFVQTFAPLEQFAGPWQFLTFSSWYLTPLGLLLGVVGLMYVGNLHRKHLDFVWLLLVIQILPLVILGSGTYPDQFWAIRRFVPIALPTLLLFAVYVLWDLMPKQRSNWLHAVLPVSFLGILVVGNGLNLWPFFRFTDYQGMIDQVSQLHESFPEDAVLLFENSDAANRVTAPLWFIHDRTVFILEDGAISNPDLLPAVEQWQQDGRDVFWLGNGVATPELANDYAIGYEGERLLNIILAEGAIGRLPQSAGLFLGTFDVHRLEQNGAENPRSVMTIAVGAGEDGLGSSGLYPPQQQTGLSPRRWTSGDVVIEIPVTEELTEVALMMGNGRSSGVPPAIVAVSLDGTLLDTIEVTGTNDVYHLTIPEQIELSGESATLRLQMEPWVPAQTGHSADSRELGVFLDWIKLIATESESGA